MRGTPPGSRAPMPWGPTPLLPSAFWRALPSLPFLSRDFAPKAAKQVVLLRNATLLRK